MQNDWIIQIENLDVILGDRQIVRDFSLAVRKGEKVLLMGPSGSGKSTILQCVMGFVIPQGGAIRIEGKPLTHETVWELRRIMTWVAQEPDLGGGTVQEVLERPFQYRANAHLRANLDRIPELLDRFRLPHLLLEKDASTLSGGEKQRVALVMALMLDRQIILLDEVSSALDAESKKTVMSFLREAHGLTILTVSHDTEWAAAVDRVEQMPGGAL